MIAGAQIREARRLLGWDRKLLARLCRLRVQTIMRAESMDGEAPVTLAHARAIRDALERGGIGFAEDGSTVAKRSTASAA